MMPKIIHILRGKANPNSMNGVNKVVHHLATEQMRLGVDVEVWGITSTPGAVQHGHDYPLRLFPATRSRFLLSKPLREAIRQLPSDALAHLHSVFLPELYAVSRQLRKMGIRWVQTPHGGYAQLCLKKNRLVKVIYMALFEARFIKQAYKLHAIGASEVNDVGKIAPLQSVVLIPNGQDIKEVQYEPMETLLPLSRPLFGYCGRLDKVTKGLDLLLKGFASYRSSDGKGELWLIGDGPDKVWLESFVQASGLTSSINFLGPMFGTIKLSHLAQMDVFVHTSRRDAGPMAVLEAAALGKPLLVSKATNMGEYVAKYGNGIVLADNIPVAIAEAMHEFDRLFAANLLKALGKKSLSLIETELNWPHIADKMSRDLYVVCRN